jgi:hypothetical protein
MSIIPIHGNPHDFYFQKEDNNLAFVPAGLLDQQENAAPIRLQRGHSGWGAIHIARKHGHWLDQHQLQVHEMVWLKLQQAGSIYSTESDDKLKVSLQIKPPALLILRFVTKGAFYTIVTLYPSHVRSNGQRMAKFKGQPHPHKVCQLILKPQ